MRILRTARPRDNGQDGCPDTETGCDSLAEGGIGGPGAGGPEDMEEDIDGLRP